MGSRRLAVVAFGWLLALAWPAASAQDAVMPPAPPVSASAPGSPASRADAPAAHALLIGIGDYAPAGLEPLKGPANDVALMREVLTTRFAMPADRITTLLNPTHAAIAQAFATLRQRVRPHDFVYVHYSGHGSTAPDPDDPRGEDQTWVPFGARVHRSAGADDWDVLDKEIATWLAPLYAVTDDVVFVSDSCHSASVSRGSKLGVRSADSVPQPHPLLASLPKLAPPETGLRIGAARDFESAVELDPRSGGACTVDANCYGVFTWHWARALRESRPGEAWREVYDRAYARISTLPAVYQRPQLEGHAERVVFGGRVKPLVETLAVTTVTGDHATLAGGLLAGVTVGSTYRALAPSDARLRVTQVDALTSDAAVQGGSVKVADLVAEAVHAYAAPKIRLFIGAADAPADAALADRLRQALTAELTGTLAGFEFATSADSADWLLQFARPARPAPASTGSPRRLPDPAACRAACPPPELWVVSRQGFLLDEKMRFDLGRADTETARLVADLHAWAWAQEVRRLAAEGNATPLRLQLVVWRPPAGDTRRCAAGAVEGSGWARFGPFPATAIATPPQLGDCLAFEIENGDADASWYGYVVTIGPDLAVTPVLPAADANADEARIASGQRLRSPASRLYRLNAPGRETVLLLASDAPLRPQALQQAGLRGAPGSRLEALLAAAAGHRGEVESAGRWGAASVDLAIGR